MLERVRVRVTKVMAGLLRGKGRRDRASRTDPIEFKDVFDRVLEECDWVGLRAGALERSWGVEQRSHSKH